MKTNLIRLHGAAWATGYALDWHTVSSVPSGINPQGNTTFDTIRTEVGEAVFQLKYRSDFNQVDLLATDIAQTIYPGLGQISFVVPVPPSKARQKQPVVELARAVAQKVNRKFTDRFLQADQTGAQVKNLTDKATKESMLANKFYVDDFLKAGRWNVLLVDDVYASGASLEAACRALRSSPKINEIFVAVATKTRGGKV